MKKWILVCPNCGTSNEAGKESITVECGQVYFHGRCIHCEHDLEDHQDYLDWLQRADESPSEIKPSQERNDRKNDG